MIDTVKEWLKEKGFKHIVLLIVGLLMYVLFRGIFDVVAIVLIWEFLRLNWQPIKDLSTVDEKIVEQYKELEEKYNELKNDIQKVKQKTGAY
tara:strand:+ start:736 stop:1011 length:276 start_codon:yes stop_codon:yes gene_type:complete